MIRSQVSENVAEVEEIKKKNTIDKAAAEAEAKKMEEKLKDDAISEVKKSADDAAQEAAVDMKAAVREEMDKLEVKLTGMKNEINKVSETVGPLVDNIAESVKETIGAFAKLTGGLVTPPAEKSAPEPEAPAAAEPSATPVPAVDSE